MQHLGRVGLHDMQQPPNFAHMSATSKTSAPRVAIRVTRWHDACKRRGLATDVERARALGVSRTTIYRLQTEITSPSLDLIARACALFNLPIEALFEVTR